MAHLNNRKDLTEEQWTVVKNLCARFNTSEDCAATLGIDNETLIRNIKDQGYKGWKDFFIQHSAPGRISLREKQFSKAMDGSDTMLIWLGKQQLGQSDKVESQIVEMKKSVYSVGRDPNKPDPTAA